MKICIIICLIASNLLVACGQKSSENLSAFLLDEEARPQIAFTEPENVSLGGKDLLLATHLSQYWDRNLMTGKSSKQIARLLNETGTPSIYLQHDLNRNLTDEWKYFIEDIAPTYYSYSGSGEFTFKVSATRVYSIGGNFSICALTTMRDLMGAWRGKMTNLEVINFTPALYDGIGHTRGIPSNAERLLLDKDLGFATLFDILQAISDVQGDPLKFLSITTEYRVGAQIKENLPNHRIFVQYKDQTREVHSRNSQTDAPVIKFSFVDDISELPKEQMTTNLKTKDL